MPKRKRSGMKSYSRKRFKKASAKKRRRRGIYTPSQGLVVASRQLVRFKYRDTCQIDCGAVTAAYHTFSANGLYDPNITGVGHQPLGLEEWVGGGSFYNHYTVLGSRITATFIPSDSSVTLTPQWCGILVSSSTALTSTTPTTVLENKYANKRLLTLPTAKGMTTVTKKCSIKNFLGQKSLIEEDNNTGSITANPVEGVFFQVFTAPYSSFYNPTTVNVSVEIEYIALLHEPRTLSGSG